MIIRRSDLINNCCISDETVYVIGKFTIEWNYFESKFFMQDLKDRDLIDNEENLEDYLDSIDLSRQFNDFRNNVISRMWFATDTVTLKDVKNYFYSDKIRGSDKCRKLIADFLNGSDSLAGCLLAIQRIRNNMFHGVKETVKKSL